MLGIAWLLHIYLSILKVDPVSFSLGTLYLYTNSVLTHELSHNIMVCASLFRARRGICFNNVRCGEAR